MSDDVGNTALRRQVGLENLKSPFQPQLFCDIKPLLSTHCQAQVSFKTFWKKTFIFGALLLMAPGSISASSQLCPPFIWIQTVLQQSSAKKRHSQEHLLDEQHY